MTTFRGCCAKPWLLAISNNKTNNCSLRFLIRSLFRCHVASLSEALNHTEFGCLVSAGSITSFFLLIYTRTHHCRVAIARTHGLCSSLGIIVGVFSWPSVGFG